MTTELILSRVMRAPRAAIYTCWTTPEHMVHWFMPKPHFIDNVRIDPRPGGQFDSTMHIDGAAIPSRGCVLDAIPDRRFAFTDLMTADFQPVAHPGLGFSATIDLSDHADGTLYHVTARHRSVDEAQKHEAMGFSMGWGVVATQLEAYARTL